MGDDCETGERDEEMSREYSFSVTSYSLNENQNLISFCMSLLHFECEEVLMAMIEGREQRQTRGGGGHGDLWTKKPLEKRILRKNCETKNRVQKL